MSTRTIKAFSDEYYAEKGKEFLAELEGGVFKVAFIPNDKDDEEDDAKDLDGFGDYLNSEAFDHMDRDVDELAGDDEEDPL